MSTGSMALTRFNPLIVGACSVTGRRCAQIPYQWCCFNPLIVGACSVTLSLRTPARAGDQLGFNPLIVGACSVTMAKKRF